MPTRRGGGGDFEVAAAEQRPAVAVAERAEAVQVVHDRRGDLVQLGDRVELQLGDELLGQ